MIKWNFFVKLKSITLYNSRHHLLFLPLFWGHDVVVIFFFLVAHVWWHDSDRRWWVSWVGLVLRSFGVLWHFVWLNAISIDRVYSALRYLLTYWLCLNSSFFWSFDRSREYIFQVVNELDGPSLCRSVSEGRWFIEPTPILNVGPLSAICLIHVLFPIFTLFFRSFWTSQEVSSACQTYCKSIILGWQFFTLG